MATRARHTCRYCDFPTETAVQSAGNKRRVFICMAQKCWTKYWAEFPAPDKKKKG